MHSIDVLTREMASASLAIWTETRVVRTDARQTTYCPNLFYLIPYSLIQKIPYLGFTVLLLCLVWNEIVALFGLCLWIRRKCTWWLKLIFVLQRVVF